MTSSLGEHLRNARDRQGLQQKDVAEAVGVSQGLVSNWEKNKKTPSVQQMQKLANTLDLDVIAMLDRQFDICDDVERAILLSTTLTRKEQDALLAMYGFLAERDSASKAAFFRAKVPRAGEVLDAVPVDVDQA